MKLFMRVVLLSFALLAVLTPANAVAQVVQIFWSVNQGPSTSTSFFGNKIQRANPDGSGVIDLITGLSRPTGLAVAGGQLYWNDWNTRKTQRANFDGSGVTTLFTGPRTGLSGLAVDLASGRVFIAEGTPGAEAVVRTNLDGTGRTVFTRTGFPGGVALDLANGHVYSANADTNPGPLGINRHNLDGTGFTTILPLTPSNRPRGIALDLSAGHIYFTAHILFNATSGSVKRVNFDGTGLVTLVSGLNFPHGIALDLAGGEMYWADIINGVIQRANLDGSSVTTLVSGINRPHGIALQIQTSEFSKDLTSGPDNDGDGEIDVVVEVGQTLTTEYDFDITYTNPGGPDVLIVDTVPAEWNVIEIESDGTDLPVGPNEVAEFSGGFGAVDVFRTGKGAKSKSSTKILWTPDPDGGTINVVATTRQSPGKKFVKFAPTSCGALFLNSGPAQVFEIDPATGEPLRDPITGEKLPALFEAGPLCLAAVEDVNGDGVITRDGTGDEDGDGLTDFAEACELGTDPCTPDAPPSACPCDFEALLPQLFPPAADVTHECLDNPAGTLIRRGDLGGRNLVEARSFTELKLPEGLSCSAALIPEQVTIIQRGTSEEERQACREDILTFADGLGLVCQ